MSAPSYEDLIYEEKDGVATITVNRPESLNAFRLGTYEEVTDAIRRAGWNREIGVIVLTGAGNRAFGVGGDSKNKKWERAGRGTIGVPVEDLHAAIREVPKPVIAKVRGYAIGGGNVICTICDLTIAAKAPSSDRSGRRWARWIRDSALRTWRAASAKRKRASCGICAGATPRARRLPWDW